MTGIEKDTIAEITNIVSKTASIVKIWHNVFFKSTLLNKYHSKCWKIKFSYLDWRTIMDARFPTNPRTPIIGNRSPSIVNFIAFRNHSILKLGFKKLKNFPYVIWFHYFIKVRFCSYCISNVKHLLLCCPVLWYNSWSRFLSKEWRSIFITIHTRMYILYR